MDNNVGAIEFRENGLRMVCGQKQKWYRSCQGLFGRIDTTVGIRSVNESGASTRTLTPLPAFALRRSCRLRLLFTFSILGITISHSEAAVIVLRIGRISTLVVLHIAAQNK